MYVKCNEQGSNGKTYIQEQDEAFDIKTCVIIILNHTFLSQFKNINII